MPNGFDLFKNRDGDVFRSLFNASFVASYGFVHEVLDDDNVLVRIAYKFGNSERIVQCTYVVPSNGAYELDVPPQVGDRVLILALQNKSPEMFTSAEPVKIDEITGYGFLSCLAFPVGTRKGKAKVISKVTATKASVSTALDAEVTVKSLKLNGSGNHFVTWEELDKALQNILTILKSHVHPDPVSGVTGTSAELSTATLDISKAKTPNLETGDQ